MEENGRKIALRLTNVGKVYRLGEIGGGTLQRDLQSWWARKRGKEDPNLPIGQEHRLEGDRFIALRDINLTVYEGECLGIIGGNGAGKSTMLKLISRVTMPTTGSLDICGRVTSMLEVGTGFHGDMTGRENIYLNGTILGMSKKEIDAVLEDIIDFSEVRDFIDTPVKRYSSGMYVKLAFSVAAHLDSEIVIMDEVLAVGDIAFQKKCLDKMRRAAKEENRTVLYVSHNMNTIRTLCDRCVVLDEGQLRYDGDVEEAIQYYSDFLLGRPGKSGRVGDFVRRDRKITGLARVEDILVETPTLRIGETLDFRVCLRCAKPLAGVRIRLIVCNAAGEIVGMAFSEPHALPEGESVLSCRFDTNPLSAGGYVCDMAVVEYENDCQTRHDFVSKVLPFQIEENILFFGQPWLPRNWGNMRLEPIQITEVRSHE